MGSVAEDTDLIAALQAAVGADQVLHGERLAERPAGFWSRHALQARALVRPATTEEVSAILKVCHQRRQPVITHGGLTGLVGGAICSADDVVLSLERMNQIEELDPVDRLARVQAGVILQQLQEAADAQDLLFPLDLGGRGSATIGGNISTNAGGNRVIRYGMTRDLVLGLEAVLADGTVVSSMNQMIKNNTGYDLKQLFIGAEGTLGVVTRAVVKLSEKPRSQQTLFVALNSFAEVKQFLKLMDARLGGALSAFEVMWQNFYRLVTTEPATNQAPLSQNYPFYALVESMGGDPEADQARLEAALADAYEAGLIQDAVVAQSEAQRSALWAMRDDVRQMGRVGPGSSFDVSVRLSRMEDYVNAVNARLAARFPDFTNIIFGHLGDGNLHFYVAPGQTGDGIKEAVERAVYEPLADYDGSISAEHGIGLSKKAYLSLSRSADEIRLMQTLKQALDPHNLLNPGRIIDPA